MFRMKVWKFCLFDGAGSLIWAGAYSALGWIFRDQLEALAEKALGMGSWLLTLIVGAVGGWILWKYIERRRFYRELEVARITPQELRELLQSEEPVTVVDVRNALEWTVEGAQKLPGALHMSFEDLAQRLNEIPRDRDVVLYCT
jgi:hypothetical protein